MDNEGGGIESATGFYRNGSWVVGINSGSRIYDRVFGGNRDETMRFLQERFGLIPDLIYPDHFIMRAYRV